MPGGIIFNPKIYVADFGSFKQGLLSMKLIQNSKSKAVGNFSENSSDLVAPFPKTRMPIRMSTRMKPLIEDEGAKGTLTFFCKHCNERMELAVNREMLRNWALSSSLRG